MPINARCAARCSLTLLLVLTPQPPVAVAAPPRPRPRPAVLTDPSAVVGIPLAPKPGYRVPGVDPTFGTHLQRIVGDPGLLTSPVTGTWGSDARHTYSKQQPWSADHAFYCLENRVGGSPSPLFLDGKTFEPTTLAREWGPLYDFRWHPSRAHAREMINVNSAGTELSWLDVTTGVQTRRWTLPIASDYGIGSGEGNASRDGRFVCVANATSMVVVDMDPRPPHAPYPNRRIGPVHTFAPCSLLAGDPTACEIDHVSISASGRYVALKYSGTTDTTYDAHRIFEVDSVTLALRPHRMAQSSLRCGSFAARPNGWIFPLKHPDLALDPSDGDEDVIVGGRACPGSSLGHVVKVRLRDGRVTALTDPANEPSVQHVSTRNLDRPGWAYVGYYKADGRKFSDEIVAVKLDGSRQVERYAHKHSAASGCYRCESHPVPSPDGSRIAFASNWAQDCGAGCGSLTVTQDYVLTAADALADSPESALLGEPGPALAIERVWPNPASLPVRVAFSIPTRGHARLELVDVSGRLVLEHDLGVLAAGAHDSSLGDGVRLRPGTYWLRLSWGMKRTTSRVVILH